MLYKSNMITQASGSIGGITASRNRGGMYFRARTVPTNPNTSFQADIRQAFSALSAGWSSLTAEQRAAWRLYAENSPVINSLGDPIKLSGQQMFIRCNVARLQAEMPIVPSGPTTFGVSNLSPVPNFEVTESTQNLDVDFSETDEWAGQNGSNLLVYISRPVSPATNFFKGPFRFAGLIEGDATSPPSPIVQITAPFVVTTGQHVFARLIAALADGRLSNERIIGPLEVVMA